MKTIRIYITVVTLMVLTACEKIKKDETHLPVLEGVFIVNEGAFGQSKGDISFVTANGSTKIPNLFYAANQRPAGDVVQSMSIINNRAYIVANNSQKIEVVRMEDFKSIGVIGGFASPRYILPINNSIAYVSDWFDNNIKIIDLNSLSITGTIPAGNGPEQMVMFHNKVYVTNVGGFGNDSTVTVINTWTNSVDTTLTVGVNPNSIKADANGNLWVLCGGSLGADFTPNTADDIGGKLLKIDPSTNAVISSFDFAQGEHPVKLTSNADHTKLYFLRGSSSYTGNVCAMDINANALPSNSIIDREFYGLGVSPINENIFGGIGSFSANSWMLYYNSNGVIIDSVQVGIGPNGFVFN